MQVTSYLCRFRRLRRDPVAAGLLLWFASIAGVAQATEFNNGFDEKQKAPMAMGATELKSSAQGYSDRFARLREASPAEQVTNKALFLEHFDLVWQINRALEDKRPLEDLSALGLVKYEGGLPHRLQRVSAVAAVSGGAGFTGADLEHGQRGSAAREPRLSRKRCCRAQGLCRHS